METKLQQNNNPGKLPAGIMQGTEAFWHNGEKWVIHEGQTMRFQLAPGVVQRTIANAFLNDGQSRMYIKNILGISVFSESLDTWYRCVVGALDETPDFVSGKLQPDAYNRQCADYNCPHRGKLCSLATGLKFYEVATINALKAGFSEEQTAALLYISLPGLKSRIEKMKEKLGATNMASMMARAVEIGI